jgi:hypothetical protein
MSLHFLARRGYQCSRRYSSQVPWFVDQESAELLPKPSVSVPPPADDAPKPLKDLYFSLANSPYLEPAQLLVTRPLPGPPGPLLTLRGPSGSRRRRGGTMAGESIYDVPGGLWSWLMFAQASLVQFTSEHI